MKKPVEIKIKNNSIYLRDLIIYVLLIALLVYIGFIIFSNSEDSENNIIILITEYIGIFVTILLGVVGIFEFAYDNGLPFIVPHTFSEYKEKRYREQTKQYLKDFFVAEAEYFSQHSNSRISYFLNQLDLSRNEFDILRMNIYSIKLMPLHSLEDAQDKLTTIIKSGNIIINQENHPSEALVYHEVKYFINFRDIMYVDDYQKELSSCLALLIKSNINPQGINRIIVPEKSDDQLGLCISHLLYIPLIKVTQTPFILKDRCWYGNFSSSKNSSIIVHDVLVSGHQIIDSIEKIKAHTSVVAIFCLINRLCDPEKKTQFQQDLKRILGQEIPVYSLIELTDEDIEKNYLNY